MLIKRTGRGPDAEMAPAVTEEGAEDMTADEAPASRRPKPWWRI